MSEWIDEHLQLVRAGTAATMTGLCVFAVCKLRRSPLLRRFRSAADIPNQCFLNHERISATIAAVEPDAFIVHHHPPLRPLHRAPESAVRVRPFGVAIHRAALPQIREALVDRRCKIELLRREESMNAPIAVANIFVARPIVGSVDLARDLVHRGAAAVHDEPCWQPSDPDAPILAARVDELLRARKRSWFDRLFRRNG
jgi:hypothetical protein